MSKPKLLLLALILTIGLLIYSSSHYEDFHLIQLTSTNESEYFCSWSPDGSKIGFVKIEESGRHIWVMDKDGSNQTPLTADLRNTECAGSRWSPDGKKIAFSTFIFQKCQRYH